MCSWRPMCSWRVGEGRGKGCCAVPGACLTPLSSDVSARQEVIHQHLEDQALKGGDSLLVVASHEAVNAIRQDGRFAVPAPRKNPKSIGPALQVILAVVMSLGIYVLWGVEERTDTDGQ